MSSEDGSGAVRVHGEPTRGFLARAIGALVPTTPFEWTYALVVAVSAGLGFATGSTPAILIAALLALPMSLAALPTFYAVYGLLALIPGADPDVSTGSASCGPHGDCPASTTGDVTTWFAVTTGLLGVLALTAAALLNVVVFRSVIAARRQERQPSHPGP